MRYQTLEEMVVATATSVRPPERLTVSQAAAKYRWLNNPGSYVGYWPNEKTPYLVEPMDEMTSLEFTGLAFVGPARTGKSDMFFNWLTYTAICDPADMMLVSMTQNTARDWSQGDLAKMLRAREPGSAQGMIDKLLLPGKQNSNVHDKRFINGMRLLIKWPTITELSGKTIPRLWINDYDRMKQNVDGEGNPFDLTRKRAATFKRFGMCVAEASPGFEVKDPKWMATSPHEAPPTEGLLAIYNRGDRRRWQWRCPQCDEPFEPDFKLFDYPKSADKMESAEQVTLVCPHDGFPMTPDMKIEMNLGGRWVKEGQVWLPDGTMAGTARRSDIASFWMKGPAAAFQDWDKLVLNYLTAMEEFENTGSEESLKTTTNVDQGLPYIPKAMLSDRRPEELKERAYDWGGSADEPVVPDGVRFLIATIDVQARSFVVQVHGIGPGGIWLVDMFKIRKSARLDDDGDPLPLDPGAYAEDWHTIIEQVIEKTYPLGDGSGRRMAVFETGSDSGGEAGVTVNAYNFWRYLRDEHPAGHHKRFYLVKGEPSKSAPRIRLGYPDSQRKDRHSGARGDVPVLFINANLMKDQVSNILGRGEQADGVAVKIGMVHFPIWAEGWLYTQLTSEVRNPKGEWKKPHGKRNEAFDLLSYAVALAVHYPIRLEQLDWSSPPRWAAEWAANDLVGDSTFTIKVENQQKGARGLSSLAASLA